MKSIFNLFKITHRFLFLKTSIVVLLFALPLISIDYSNLTEQYKNWGVMLANDHDSSLGFSVMGWLHTWFHLNTNKNLVLLAGIIIYLIPLVRYKNWGNEKYRLLMLASTLIWVVIFNHKAESPTFVIPTDIFPSYVRTQIFVPYVIKSIPMIIIWGKIIYELTLGFDKNSVMED